MSTPNADASAVILTNKLRNKWPLVFTKFGDGTLWWMSGNPVQSANGEVYRPGIDTELRNAACTLGKLPHVYFGDQLTCSSGPYLATEQDAYIYQMFSPYPLPWVRWLHFETLLIHRLSPELLEFYQVLKERKHKLFCGGSHLIQGADMLGCSRLGWFLPVDTHNSHTQITSLVKFLENGHKHQNPERADWEILLLAAGHASKLIAAAMASKFPDRTIIELGSALDPLFVGRTRSEQIEPAVAREYFKGIL